jgi:hypothetical protein
MKYIVKTYSDRILFARLCTFLLNIQHFFKNVIPKFDFDDFFLPTKVE